MIKGMAVKQCNLLLFLATAASGSPKQTRKAKTMQNIWTILRVGRETKTEKFSPLVRDADT